MNSVRCGACALVNFTTASSCKRCGSPLGSPEVGQSPSQEFGQVDPQWSETHYRSSPSVDGQYQQYFPDSSLSSRARTGKTIAIVLVALVALVAAVGIPWYLKGSKSELADISWRPFTSNDGAFSIMLPSEPKLTSVERDTPDGRAEFNMYYAEIEGKTAFGVGSIKFPASTHKRPADMFDKAYESLNGRSQLIVLNRKEIMLDGYPGVEWELKPPVSANRPGDKGIARVYWAAPRFFMVMVGGPDSPEAAAARTKYLDSFKIKEQPLTLNSQ